MAKIFELAIYNDNRYRTLKQFDASGNSEEVIASALYEGYKTGAERTFVTTYYADGYSHYCVINGDFKPDVVDYEEVKDLDHGKIGELFNEYKNNQRTPLVVKDAFSFLKENVPQDKEEIVLGDFPRLFRDSDVLDFFEEVSINPSEYPNDILQIVGSIIIEKARMRLFSNCVPDLPDKYLPKNLSISKLDFNTYEIKATIDGHPVRMMRGYDPHSIEEFGNVSDVELASVIAESYIWNTVLEPVYEKYLDRKEQEQIEM